jgi:hypothetical protein
MSLGSRQVPARRTLAVLAAVVALPWPLALLVFALENEGGEIVVLATVVVAAIVAAPAVATRRWFPWLAAGLWLVLLALGFLGAWVGGVLAWPGSWLFMLSALPLREATWSLASMAAVACGVVLACLTVWGLAALVGAELV